MTSIQECAVTAHSVLHQIQRRCCIPYCFIQEAHAIDEWPVGDGYGGLKGFRQPKTIEQRIAVAKEFVGDFTYGVPMAVDSMANHFDNAFACWPVRYYIIHKGQIYYKAQPNAEEYTYSVEELRAALAKCVGRMDWSVDDEEAEGVDDCDSCASGSSSASCAKTVDATLVDERKEEKHKSSPTS